jgi:hypothetical protein
LRSTSKRPCHLPLRPMGIHTWHTSIKRPCTCSKSCMDHYTARGFSGCINHQPNKDYQLVHKNTREPVKSKSLPQKRRLHAMTFTDRRPQSTYGSNTAEAEEFRTPPLIDREIHFSRHHRRTAFWFAAYLFMPFHKGCNPARITRDTTRLIPSDFSLRLHKIAKTHLETRLPPKGLLTHF